MAVTEGFVEWISPGVAKMQWTATAVGIGNAHYVGGAINMTVQFDGMPAGTTSMRLDGSNTPARATEAGTFLPLTDPTGGTLLTLANLISEVQERPQWIQPNVTTATTATGITCTVIATFR